MGTHGTRGLAPTLRVDRGVASEKLAPPPAGFSRPSALFKPLNSELEPGVLEQRPGMDLGWNDVGDGVGDRIVLGLASWDLEALEVSLGPAVPVVADGGRRGRGQWNSEPSPGSLESFPPIASHILRGFGFRAISS